MSTVRAAITTANRLLMDAGFTEAVRDTRRLMAASLQITPDRLLMHSDDPLGDVTEAAFFAMIEMRCSHMPVSRILGSRDFYGRAFQVTPDVLDPRPETETLIAQALDTPFTRFLDLGTGSGAIAVTLLAERVHAKGVAADISQGALSVASMNAKTHDVDARLGLIESDWFSDVTGTFDLIVSNPPYIALDEMDGLSRDVIDHDPRIALTDEADGLTAYESIAADAPQFLNTGGHIMVEIGPTQANAVMAMFQDVHLKNVQIVADLDGRDRVICAQKT